MLSDITSNDYEKVREAEDIDAAKRGFYTVRPIVFLAKLGASPQRKL